MCVKNFSRCAAALGLIVLAILACGCASIRNKRFAQAVEKGDVLAVRDLLGQGADPRALAADGTTPVLVRAAAAGNTEIVDELLKAGAPVDFHIGAGDTALLAAARASRPATVKLLCERGADAAYSSGQGDTPVSAAVARAAASKQENSELTETLHVLLSRKPDLNARNAKGQTPLMLAATGNSAQVVIQLLVAGARIDETDIEGRTAIMVAAAAGQAETVEYLRNMSARTDLRDKQGHTAADIARSAGHPEIASNLEAVFQDGRWSGKTSAGTALSFTVAKGRLTGTIHLTVPGGEGVEELDVNFAEVDRDRAPNPFAALMGVRVVRSGPSYSGSLDVSRGNLEISLEKTFMVFRGGALMRGERQEPRMGGTTAEIRGRGTPAGTAEGTITISNSEAKGQKKLTWTARRAGA